MFYRSYFCKLMQINRINCSYSYTLCIDKIISVGPTFEPEMLYPTLDPDNHFANLATNTLKIKMCLFGIALIRGWFGK